MSFMVLGVSPLSAIFTLFRGASRLTAQIRTNVGSVGEPGILPEILPLFSRQEIPEIFRPLAHPPRLQKQVAPMPLLFLMTVDSQFLKDNELDLVQSQSILRNLMKGPFEKPPKEPRNTRAHLTKEVILFQGLLSILVLPTAKSLTLLLQILMN